METSPAELAARLQRAIGSRLSIVRPVATGSTATVYLLRHHLHDGLLAAKLLRPELAEEPEATARFWAAAKQAAWVGSHPNAVPVFDCVETDGLCYVLMPYIEGADLSRVLLRAGPLSRDETLQIAAQISSVLCHMEALDLVHGGLTPGKIRLDIHGQYRLLGLGLSQARGPQMYPYAGGESVYRSPEQIAGQPLDIRSDLYSLGAVLRECLGKRITPDAKTPGHHEGEGEMSSALAEGDPLRRLLSTLLSTDPADRPHSAFELSGILHALGWARPEFRPMPAGVEPFMGSSGRSHTQAGG